MKKGYQRRGQKSNGLRPRGRGKFELLGGREVEMRMPLPLVEVWEKLQAEVERLAGEAGLQILRALLEDEVRQRVGPAYHPDPAQGARRWGSPPGYVVFGGQKIALERPRVPARQGGEVELETYRKLQQDGRMQRAVRERMVCGLSTRIAAPSRRYWTDTASRARASVGISCGPRPANCKSWRSGGWKN